MTEIMDRKIYSRRSMRSLRAKRHNWAQVGVGSLAQLLTSVERYNREHLDARIDIVFLCGSDKDASRRYFEEPLSQGWAFKHPFTFKDRGATYQRGAEEIYVKLVSHRDSWFPGCEDQVVACEAWRVFRADWESSTGLPLLSSPSKTGQALLWEMLPQGQEFPALPADVEKIVRANSPQHRIEDFETINRVVDPESAEFYQYDGRWMYAALATLDRLPIGEPRRVGYFKPYEPGWHKMRIKIPDSWDHIGLIPCLDPDGVGWVCPNGAGSIIEGWVSEPELTLALSHGWEVVEHCDGWVFDKGRPLGAWAKKLIDMRRRFRDKHDALAEKYEYEPDWESPQNYVAAAVRQILNHTIGSLHARGYERELFVSDDDWKAWRRENAGWFDLHRAERVEGKGWNVTHWVPDDSPLSINMPHWSATIWALERARVAQYALRCNPATIVKINGDAIYSTAELPFEDNGNLGQLRRKE